MGENKISDAFRPFALPLFEEEFTGTITALLPDELLQLILTHLDFLTLCKAAKSVCRRWRELSTDRDVIKNCFFAALKDSAHSYLEEVQKRKEASRLTHNKRAKGDDTDFFIKTLKADLRLKAPQVIPCPQVLNLQSEKADVFGMISMCVEGDEILTGSAGKSIRIWEINSGKLKQKLCGHLCGVNVIKVADKKIISGSFDETVRIWDRKSGRELKKLIGQTGSVSCLQVECEKIYSGSYDGTLRVWDLESGIELKKFENNCSITCMQVFDKKVYVGFHDGTIRIFDSESEVEPKKFNDFDVSASSILATSNKIIVGYKNGFMSVLDKNLGNRLTLLNGHNNHVSFLNLYNGKIISGSKDGTIRIWDEETGEEIKVLKVSVEFFFLISLQIIEGKIYAGFNDNKILIWDFNAP